jgi:hypothetical protein
MRREFWRRVLEISRRAAKWVAAVLAVSLVLPAATKQWGDNQQQRQLKTEVTSTLAAAVAKATTEGGFLLDDRIAGTRSEAGLREAFQDTMATWRSEAAAIDSQLVGYFAKTRNPDDDGLVLAMRAYDRVVQNYLAYCLLPGRSLKEFYDNVRAMRVQTRRERGLRGPLTPPVIRSYVRGADWPDGFRTAAKDEWVQNIIDLSAPLRAMVYERQPNGLEVGARAFIRQIIPFN